MNRKSIAQIFVLVLLIAVGAGVYLSQQPGGLDFIRELVGLGPSTPPKVVMHKPVRKHAVPAPRPKPLVAAKPKKVSPVIPATPASGELFNTAFAVDSAQIEDGVLTLRQGNAPAATEVSLFLHTKSWQVPAGRHFNVSGSTAASGSMPTVHVSLQTGGRAQPQEHDFANKYTLKLELGKLQNAKLPGKIYLALPDSNNSHIAGTFTANVRGFHFVDGKPDLSSDSVDTLQYLALREVLKNDPDMPLKDVAFRQGRYQTRSADGPPTGYIEIQYRVGDAAPVERKLQFAKEQNVWRVVATLRPDQLDAAHPRETPVATDPPERVFPYLAAKRIEADAHKRDPGGQVLATDFATRYNESKKIGVTEVGYKISDDDPVQAAFLFRLDKKGWTLVRELKSNERVNLASGKVEVRR